MRKRKKSLEIEGKEACFSSIMKTNCTNCTNYTLFYKQGCEQRWYDEKTVGICSKTTGFGPKWVKILEKNL